MNVKLEPKRENGLINDFGERCTKHFSSFHFNLLLYRNRKNFQQTIWNRACDARVVRITKNHKMRDNRRKELKEVTVDDEKR